MPQNRPGKRAGAGFTDMNPVDFMNYVRLIKDPEAYAESMQEFIDAKAAAEAAEQSLVDAQTAATELHDEQQAALSADRHEFEQRKERFIEFTDLWMATVPDYLRGKYCEELSSEDAAARLFPKIRQPTSPRASPP